MTDLLTPATDLKAFGVALLVFGLLPGLVMRLLLLLYPKGHPRRVQIRADFDAIEDYWKRPFFAAQTVESALLEGLPQRIRRMRIQHTVASSLMTSAALVAAFGIGLAVAVSFGIGWLMASLLAAVLCAATAKVIILYGLVKSTQSPLLGDQLCQLCGTNMGLTVDHIIPMRMGGSATPENIHILCRRCNQRAARRPDAQ